MNHDVSSFLSGCAPFNDLVFFAKELDELAETGTQNSSFFSFDEQDKEAPFRIFSESVGWPAIAMATTKPPGHTGVVVALGADGRFWEGQPETLLESTGRFETNKGQIRSSACIDDIIFACGMGRTVLRRVACGEWQEFGPADDVDGEKVVGFEDLDGFSQSEIYAVGWGGEIWLYNGTYWLQAKSPVRGTLNAVFCAEDGVVYIAGDNGVLLRGRQHTWEVVDSGIAADITDIAFHGGILYAATDSAIYCLGEGGLIEEDNFTSGEAPTTCLLLLKAQDGIVSLGPKDMWRKTNGSWHRLV
jgi:hypothetical protein